MLQTPLHVTIGYCSSTIISKFDHVPTIIIMCGLQPMHDQHIYRSRSKRRSFVLANSLQSKIKVNYHYTCIVRTETNGVWSSWSKYSNCSKACYGRKKRTRTCDNPPPVGQHRTCPGSGLEYQMCNELVNAQCDCECCFLSCSRLENCRIQGLTRLPS